MTRHGMYAPGTVRFQHAMPEELLDRLRTRAREEGTTVSALLREGAELRLAAPKRK